MNANPLNRRDFLKLASLLPLSLQVPALQRLIKPASQSEQKPKNVVIIVFDAFSAYNISTYGYERLTTPNINRLAKRAIVYHNHFAGGSFTTPGTASLLTGVLPWTHRGFRPNSEVDKSFESKNIFTAFPEYYRITYTHNGWAYTLLNQFGSHIEQLISRGQFLLDPYDRVIQQLFRNDDDIASVSSLRAMKLSENGQAYSLFFSHLYDEYERKQNKDLLRLFPRGIPSAGTDNFLLETATQAVGKKLTDIPQPFLGYFHFLPPHAPYRTSKEFYNAFEGDGYRPAEKPVDIFGRDINNILPRKRKDYDEFILYCDQEFGKLYDHLESSGLLENTLLVLTSDHGEMNERGISGHMVDALYQPVVRIPLMIFEPGRREGMEIHESTSAIDLLPTLAHLTGKPNPSWTEGVVLPPFNATDSIPNRNIYVLRASHNDQYAPITIASTVLVRENYKLHYYFGYPEVSSGGLVRLFDVKSDPEEMSDLVQSKPDVAAELLNELKAKLTEVNAPYS